MSAARISPVLVPKWGLSMTEGTVKAWLVEEGAAVESGDELLDLETEKAVGQVEAFATGILRRQLAGEGDTLPLGGLLGVIADPDVSDAEIDSFIAERQAGGMKSPDPVQGDPGPPVRIPDGATRELDPFPREDVSALVRRLPSYLRLATGLARDARLPRWRRAAVVAAAAYVASPIDLVPGVVPVLGQLDDILVAVVALRAALGALDPQVRAQHLAAAGLTDRDMAADLATLGATTAWLARRGLRAGAVAVRAGARAAVAGSHIAARTGRALAERGRGIAGRGTAAAATLRRGRHAPGGP